MHQSRCRSALDTIEENEYEKVALAHRSRISSSSESTSVHTESSQGYERFNGQEVVWLTPAEGLRYTAVLGNDQDKAEIGEQERRLFLKDEERRSPDERHEATTFASSKMTADTLAKNNYAYRYPSTTSDLENSFYDNSTQRITTETRKTVRMEHEEREYNHRNNHLSNHTTFDKTHPEPNERTIPIRCVDKIPPSPIFKNNEISSLQRDRYDLAQKPLSSQTFKTTESSTLHRRDRHDCVELLGTPSNDAHKCNSCEVLLNDMLTYIREGKYYCQQHYETQSRSLNVEDNNGFKKRWDRDSYKTKTPPRCAGCDELIFDRDLLMANGAFWHRDHFRCGICGELIGTGLYQTIKKKRCCCRCLQGNQKRVVRIDNASKYCEHQQYRKADTRYVLCAPANHI